MSTTNTQRKVTHLILTALMALALVATPVLIGSAEAGPVSGGGNVISTG